jgi:hypothetical protein
VPQRRQYVFNHYASKVEDGIDETLQRTEILQPPPMDMECAFAVLVGMTIPVPVAADMTIVAAVEAMDMWAEWSMARGLVT